MLLDTPKHTDLVYDLGMHKGEDTEFYLRKGFRVVAVEADPELVRRCREEFQEFIRKGQLTIVEGAIVSPDALGSGRQKIPFYRNHNNSVWGTAAISFVERNTRLGTSSSAIDVDAVDIVGVIERHGIPHYMKIDLEGLDLACVVALGRFRNRPDYISIESDKTSLANIRHEIETLTALGYDSFQAVEQSAIAGSPCPPPPAREGSYVAGQFRDCASGPFGAELGGRWKRKGGILRQYRIIRFGYYLVGDDGILTRRRFRGAGRLRRLAFRSLSLVTRAVVPGWYDTHARHSSVGVAQ